MHVSKKILITITGASGSIYAQRLIEKLSFPEISSQLNTLSIVFSKTGSLVWKHELGTEPNIQPFKIFDDNDYFAPFASGSSAYDTMIICPCSMGTIGRISSGISDTLITRAADVMLKERKKIIAVIRETPLSSIHLENLLKLSNNGVVILPASPSFYSNPKTSSEIIDTVIDRVLDHAGIKFDTKRWGNV